MSEIDEREKQMTESKGDRRSFFQQASKYLLGVGVFIDSKLRNSRLT